jgi:hypothetical protein
MPIPEVADRFTIAKLKLERAATDEADRAELQRQVDYYSEGIDWHNMPLACLVGELYEANARLWDTEGGLRAGLDSELGLEEIGKLAIQVRDLNIERAEVKNEIIELTGDGFVDNKTNYGRRPPAPGTEGSSAEDHVMAEPPCDEYIPDASL